MSLEGIGEPYFIEIVRTYVLRNLIVLPPWAVHKVDMVVGRDLVLVEVEDTVQEIYSGTKQLWAVAEISRALNAGFLLVVPYPRDVDRSIMPIGYFFTKLTTEIPLPRKELWLVLSSGYSVIRLKLKHDSALPIAPATRSVLVELELDEVKRINELLRDAYLQLTSGKRATDGLFVAAHRHTP